DLPGSIRVASPGAFPKISHPYAQLRGEGTTFFLIDSNDQGRFIELGPEEAAYNVQNPKLRDFNIYATADTTAGTALTLHDCAGPMVHNVAIHAHYNPFNLIGGNNGEYSQFELTSDASFAEYRAGS